MSKLTIIADDDPVVRHIGTSMLTSAGMQVEVASSGKECLELLGKLTHSAKTPAVLFLDIQLPDMSGAEVEAAIRKNAVLKDLAIVILSANSEEETKTLFPQLNYQGFLQKPFSQNDILRILSNSLNL